MIVQVTKSIQWSLKLHLYKNVFSSQQKMVSVGAVQTDASRLFHACKMVTGSAQSPKSTDAVHASMLAKNCTGFPWECSGI